MIDLAISLAGCKIIEICNFVSGPMVGRNLAALGAEVIKLERPDGGDDGRYAHPSFDGEGLFFTETAYGKKSVVLDLKSQAGLATALKLIDTADIVIENMRPSVMARIGLDPAMLVERNPTLIVASVSAFDPGSKRADDPAYDPVIQAATGVMFSTGFAGDPPRRVGASIIDKTTALWSTIQILAALQQRERTMRGGHITVSMLSAAVHMMGADILRYLATGSDVAPSQPNAKGGGASHGAYRAKDGRWIQIAVGNDRMYERLCRAAGHEELLSDPRFSTQLLRGANRVEENEAMTQVIGERESNEWVSILSEAKIPFALINHISQFVADEELSAPFMGTGVRSGGNEVPLVRGPLDPPDAPPAKRRVPKLGEDTEDILHALGMSCTEIRELTLAKAFGAKGIPATPELLRAGH